MSEPIVRAAGILILRPGLRPEFLLMRHPHRWDLPKGRAEAGETLLETALRETHEETGIPPDALEIDPEFRFESRYRLPYRDRPGKTFEKTVTYFLGFLRKPVEIRLTEHPDYRWFPWRPPHQIQTQTVDPLLAAIAAHLSPTPERLTTL